MFRDSAGGGWARLHLELHIQRIDRAPALDVVSFLCDTCANTCGHMRIHMQNIHVRFSFIQPILLRPCLNAENVVIGRGIGPTVQLVS